MLKFPDVPEGIEPPRQRMNLREYALFSIRCLQGNPSMTARNCLHRRQDEQFMKPFRLPARPDAAGNAGDAQRD